MKNILLLSLLIICEAYYLTNAQVGASWIRRYDGSFHSDDFITALAVDRNGNVYVTGSCHDLEGESITTIKYSSSGQLKWVAKFKPSQYGNRRAYGIALDDSMNVYVTGQSNSLEFQNAIVTIKYDSSGQQKWFKYFGPNIGGGKAITLDTQGNIYVTGYYTFDVLGFDYITIKYDCNGEQQWFARYTNSVYGNDLPSAIAVDDIGNVYVTGTSYDSTTHYDLLTVKYSSLGQQLWVNIFDGSGLGSQIDDCANALSIDGAGNIIVAGGIKGTGSLGLPPEYFQDCITIKYNSNGDTLWTRKYDSGRGADWASDLTIDNDNNIYLAGTAQGVGTNGQDYLCLKYNSAGDLIWDRYYNGRPVYGGEDNATGIAVDNLGNVYLSGESKDGPMDYDDYATIKYNSSGDLQWVIRYDGPVNGVDKARSITLDTSNNVIVSGISKGVDTYYDFLTIKYVQTELVTTTLSANVASGSQVLEVVSSTDFSVGDSLIINPGGVNEEGNIISGFGSILLQMPLQFDHYAGELVIKFTPTSVEENDFTLPSTFELCQNYPNPFNPSTKIRYTIPTPTLNPFSKGEETFVQLKVYDVLGNEVATLVNEYKPAGRYEVEWNPDNCASGVYFYQLKSGEYAQTKKMIFLR